LITAVVYNKKILNIFGRPSSGWESGKALMNAGISRKQALK
jgi:hypothetical protein